MNGNRGQYTSSPMYNMKKRRVQPQRPPENQYQQPGAEAPREGKKYQGLSIVMSLVLPALFLISLFVPSNPLRWAFLIAAAAALAAMWALGAFVKSARGTLTVAYTALMVVVGLALFMNSQTNDTTQAANRAAQNHALLSSQAGGDIGALLASAPALEETPAPDAAVETVSAAQQQLDSFFQAWGARNIPEMLKYCAPSWVNAQSSPEQTLWQMLQSTSPVEYQVERMEGSDGNTSRIVTMKVLFNEMSGQSLKRLQVVMVKTNEVWYVDPNSLGGVTIDEAAEAAAAAAQSSSFIGTTKAPATATPNPGTVKVYYNEQGGRYYHATATCSAVDEQYWPLTGFSFDLINSQDYKHLLPCPKCNPPERPSIR